MSERVIMDNEEWYWFLDLLERIPQTPSPALERLMTEPSVLEVPKDEHCL